MTVIDIAALSLAIGRTTVLHDVNLHLRAGEIYGLLGPNGAGKSTTLAAILGLRGAASGHIRVLDRDPATQADAIRAELGVLPERHGFYDWMTGEDYLAFFARLRGRVDGEEPGAALVQVGLSPARRQTIGSYSRGMRQRLGLARALAGRPRLLLLDEPTNGLDPRGRRDIHDVLRRLASERGVAVLLLTHLLDDVERLCDRVGVLVAGRTLAEGSVAELAGGQGAGTRFRLRLRGDPPAGAAMPAGVEVLAHDGHWRTVLLPTGVPAETAWRSLLAADWPIQEIRADEGGLESRYLALTRSGTP